MPGIKPGQRYAYRVHGAYEPQNGYRFNPAKLLIDPYARAIAGRVDWREPVVGYRLGGAAEDLEADDRDSARGLPKSVVVDETFDWGDDTLPRVPWSQTITYEAHVKGLTARHPDVTGAQRGTYAGLATEPVIDHLKRLVLLPSSWCRCTTSSTIAIWWKRASPTIGATTPSATSRRSRAIHRLARWGSKWRSFKRMVKALHSAGLEVILDLVYNHTAEANHPGRRSVEEWIIASTTTWSTTTSAIT